MAGSGKTKSIIRIQLEPGSGKSVVGILPPNITVDIVQEEGDWVLINASGKVGYVNKFFIEKSSDETELPLPTETLDPLIVPLEATESTKIQVSNTAPYLERLTGEVWNKFGGLLTVLSNQLKIDPAVAVAVFAVESGGQGFGSDGRMLIRFEIHIFYNYWGKNNETKFRAHFRFNNDQRWLGHQLRKPGESWKDIHIRQQSREWEAFNFASTLSSTAARLSISMGAPQIMGFNYKVVGFESVHEMFDTFSKGEREQIIAFFEFVKGPAGDNRRVEGLQNQDFVTFAKFYNGSGQAQKYGGLIKTVFDNYHRLKNG